MVPQKKMIFFFSLPQHFTSGNTLRAGHSQKQSPMSSTMGGALIPGMPHSLGITRQQMMM
jgi:hypothetical protein